MPDYRTMYDRDYIGHFDLPGGKDMTLTIKRVVGGELTAMGGRKSKKPIVHFAEAVKPLICNKTNAKTIAAMYGNMVEGWKGRMITLFVSTTRDPSGGGEVECIRIRPKIPNASARTHVASEPQDLEETETAADAPSTATARPSSPESAAASPSAADGGSVASLSKEQCLNLLSMCEQSGVNIGRVLLKVKAESVEQIPAAMYDRCVAFIEAAGKR